MGVFEEVAADDLPRYYRRLLDHHDHMTVTQEAVHGAPVAVEVKQRRLSRQHYERKSLLRSTLGGQVLQYCVVRLRFAYLDVSVREEIENERIPLGRILIHHNILRRVQMFALWRITTGPELMNSFGLALPTTTYGRTALIYCNGDPAVELLEIIAPREVEL
jgi:chorismate-pyruvate lyase